MDAARLPALVASAAVLTACGGPLFVPEAGPGAPGYQTRQAPVAPRVLLPTVPALDAPGTGGALDSVAADGSRLVVRGWAFLDPGEPRGVLVVGLPAGVAAEVADVQAVPRPDVEGALGRPELAHAGFEIVLRVSGGRDVSRVCVESVSGQGRFRLADSEASLCVVAPQGPAT